MGIERRIVITLLTLAAGLQCQPRGDLRFCLRADPTTFDPLRADEEPSETVRYLTAGVLIRLNRQTQRLEPELATSWTVGDQGKRIDFVLRRDVQFSDGTPFGSADVVATIRRIADPKLQSAIADAFRSGTRKIEAEATGPYTVSISFSPAVAGFEQQFDQLAICSARATAYEKAVLGPFVLADYKSGQFVLLRRNPHYWKVDAKGQKLPYISSIRLDIRANPETELLRFRRGELDFVDKLDPESFERLRKEIPSAAVNAGLSLDSEILWFNQGRTAPIPAYKQRWFQSDLFRRAVSVAINRDDLIRLAYRGYAHAAAGPVSQANRFWFNTALHPPRYDAPLALSLLRQDGFRLDGKTLRDHDGNAVEFSLITNAGNRTRTLLGTMLQEDLQKIGIRLNLATLEFQSLIERIMQTMQYEACLLGFTNVEIDPNTVMNVWPSSGSHHAWNPEQTTPATAWEAEIDALMKAQATRTTANARKGAFDRVQEIVYERVPIIYLVNPDVLVAVSPRVRNAGASALPPHLIWNIENLSLTGPAK